MGMSFVVLMERVETLVPAEEPMYGRPSSRHLFLWLIQVGNFTERDYVPMMPTKILVFLTPLSQVVRIYGIEITHPTSFRLELANPPPPEY